MSNQYSVHGALAMTRGRLMRIEDGRGMLIHVCEGALWITQEGDRRDYFVPARSSFRVDRAGLTVISAIARSAIALTPPYEPRKSSALRARLAKSWAGWFTPRARPTTASL